MISFTGLHTLRQGIPFGQCSPLLPKHQHGVSKKVQRLFERFDGESCGRGKTPIISDLTHSWWASVPDPLVGGGQVGGGEASFQGDSFSTLCPFTFCLCVMILIFNFNLDLHIFHQGGASTGSLHPQVIVAHYLLPIWLSALIWWSFLTRFLSPVIFAVFLLMTISSHAGLITVNPAFDSNMFFWFFPAAVSA